MKKLLFIVFAFSISCTSFSNKTIEKHDHDFRIISVNYGVIDSLDEYKVLRGGRGTLFITSERTGETQPVIVSDLINHAKKCLKAQSFTNETFQYYRYIHIVKESIKNRYQYALIVEFCKERFSTGPAPGTNPLLAYKIDPYKFTYRTNGNFDSIPVYVCTREMAITYRDDIDKIQIDAYYPQDLAPTEEMLQIERKLIKLNMIKE